MAEFDVEKEAWRLCPRKHFHEDWNTYEESCVHCKGITEVLTRARADAIEATEEECAEEIKGLSDIISLDFVANTMLERRRRRREGKG